MEQRKEDSDNNQSDKKLLFVFSIRQNANRQFAVTKDRLIVQPLKNQLPQCGVRGAHSFLSPKTFRNKPYLSFLRNPEYDFYE
jgi:hypothetical protein